MTSQNAVAICLTPDRKFFGPALYTAARIIACGLPNDIDLLLICEEEDIWPGYENLDRSLRDRITLLTHSFAKLIGDVPATRDDSAAIYRRLVLHRILPSRYTRLIPVDADIDVRREGLAPLATVGLGGAPIAAAIDMIFLMDLGGHLAPEFQAYRQGLGLTLDTLYFNNGLVVIDRAAWEERELGEDCLFRLGKRDGKYMFYDQSALNSLLKGEFAALSPRFNFMGDFLLLDLEEVIRPVAWHFVNRPKPWEKDFSGDPHFAESYHRWFASSPMAQFRS